MAKDRAVALLVFGDPMFFLHRARLADLAVKNRLSAMSTQGQWVDAGASSPTGRACLTSGGTPRATMTRSSGVPGPPPCPSSSPPSLSGHQPQDGTAVSSPTFARSVAHDSGQVGSLTLHMIPNGQSSPGGVRALRRTVA